MTGNATQPLEQMADEVQTSEAAIGAICQEVGAAFPNQTVVVSLIEEVKAFLADKTGAEHDPVGVSCTSFCAQTIRDKALFELVDARQDGRFADNPMVTGEPHLVYYAGVPLGLADGSVPGALSLVGNATRPKLTAHEIALLTGFATAISAALENILQP